MRRGWIFILILICLYSYTGYKIGELLPHKKILPWILTTLIFFTMVGWQFYTRFNQDIHSSVYIWVTWIGGLTTAFWTMYILLSLPFDILNFFACGIMSFSKSSDLDLQRRVLFTQIIPTAVAGASALFVTLGFRTAFHGPEVVETQVFIDNLPNELEGLKIAQISDLHVSAMIDYSYVEGVVKKIIPLIADLIVFTGDSADGKPETLKEFLEPLQELQAPLGKFFVTGNHEYYWGAKSWIQKFESLGFSTLLNESVLIKYKNTEFILGGVTDVSSEQFEPTHKSDPVLALKNLKEKSINTEKLFKLLLAHRPESCFEAAKAGWHLQLSGHTHNGQFFPFKLFMPLAHKYYRGLNRHENMQIYVNSGTGYWGPPNRFTVPSEISLLTLRRS